MPERTCPRCGATLDEGSTAAGLCARCLLSQMLVGAAEDDSFGVYRCIRKLGEGGTGIVWLAEQSQPLRRQVALKVLKPGMDSRTVISRFEDERQALASMDHPNIARIFDAGASLLGHPYFVMEYVDGVSITEYCDRRLLTTAERLGLFVEVCSAVQHVHSRGVLHRDLKPSNILVAEVEGTPRVRIIDFGIAKATGQHLAERTIFTEEGRFVGTPEYMSPEQAETSEVPLDTRTDVYSLGVVLYELLVGSLPFDPVQLRKAAMAEILRYIREEEPPRPTTRLTTLGDGAVEVARKRGVNVKALRQQIRGDLDLIVLKCLEKERNRRYGSPEGLALDIDRYLRNLPVQATGPGPLYRILKLARRRRDVVMAAVGCLLAAAAAGSLTTVLRRGAVPETPAAITALTGYEGIEMMPRFGPDGRVAFAWTGTAGGNWDIYVVGRPGEEPRRMTFDPASDSSPAWSPDGKWIAFARGTPNRRNRIMKVNAATGQEVEVVTLRSGFSAWTRAVDWSPDGHWLVVCDHPAGGRESGLHLISLDTGEDRALTTPGTGEEDMEPAWRLDGRRIAFVRDFGAGRNEIWLQNLTADRHRDGPPYPAPDAKGGFFPVWSPAGDLLFSGNRGLKFSILWRVKRGEQKAAALLTLGERNANPAVSHDGRRIVFERKTGHSAVWRFQFAADGSLGAPTPFIATTLDNLRPVFSPDGARVAFQSKRSGTQQFWLADRDGGNLRQLTFGEVPGPAVWSPDGRRIYYSIGLPGAARLVRIEAAGGPAEMLPQRGHSPSISPDGRWIYFTADDLKLARAPADGTGIPQALTTGGARYPKLSPDGQWLYFNVIPGMQGPLMRVRSDGRDEQQVVPMTDPTGFFPARDGVYYTLTPTGGGSSILWFVAYQSGAPKRIAALPRQPSAGFAISPDGRILLMGVLDQSGTDLMVADYLR